MSFLFALGMLLALMGWPLGLLLCMPAVGKMLAFCLSEDESNRPYDWEVDGI